MSNTSVKNQHKMFNSDIVTVATTAVIENMGTAAQTHYIGARYYSDSAGTPVVPGAGTITIEGLDEATNQWTDTASTLLCTDITDKETITANVLSIRGVPTVAITTATHWQLFSSSNI
jgi:hypothetical protein